jgi:hypothetical protein
MRKLILGLALVALVFLAAMCLGVSYPVDVLFNLVAGWAFYCSRVLPQVRLSPWGIVSALLCLGALAWGGHLFFRWLWSQLPQSKPVEGERARSWPARRTFALLALVVLMFVAGIAAVGVSHQTVWLATAPEPLVVGGLRSSVARTQHRNNLKQIALAMITYSDAHGVLPAAAIWDREGRPLLSWRVLILPYLDEEKLYKEFHLDEPWDSPWNLRLLGRMPLIYSPQAGPYLDSRCRTFCQVFTGPGTAFEGRRGLSLKKDFSNGGMCDTILVAEAAHAVPWTKPEDLPYSASGPLPPLGYLRPDDFAVALADGSIRPIERTESEQTIGALITRNGDKGPVSDRE